MGFMVDREMGIVMFELPRYAMFVSSGDQHGGPYEEVEKGVSSRG